MQRIAPLRDIRAQVSFEDMSSCMSGEEGIALYRSSSFDTTQQTTINWSDTLTVNPVETLKNTELRVLVVDDSRLNRKMLIKCLTLDGK
jgi:PleD family two-component response regulator